MTTPDTITETANAAASVAAPTEAQGPRMIGIQQIAHFLSAATANNKSFIIRPTDLRNLYNLVLWEHVSTNPANVGALTPLENLSLVSIEEKELVRIINLYFSNEYYKYFSTLSQL